MIVYFAIYFAGEQDGAKSAEDKSSGLISSGMIQTAMILLLQITLY